MILKFEFLAVKFYHHEYRLTISPLYPQRLFERNRSLIIFFVANFIFVLILSKCEFCLMNDNCPVVITQEANDVNVEFDVVLEHFAYQLTADVIIQYQI